MTSLSTRLALVISAVLSCLMLLVGLWLDQFVTRSIHQEERLQAESHARTMLASLQTLMLNGQGTLARSWLDRMQNAEKVVSITVLRRDGTEAFTDLNTVNQVNHWLGEPRFDRVPVEARRLNDLSASAFKRALLGEMTVDRQGHAMTILMPIPALQECLACHGYDTAPLRGVLKLTVSTATAEQRIVRMRDTLWLLATVLVLVLGVVMWSAVRFSVLVPINLLRDAIKRVGEGDRSARLTATRKDEIGEVATVFNRMQDDLERFEMRIRAVMDNVIDAIITIDERGIIESVNPAAEAIFGYPAQELVGQNVKVLMPEPYRMMHDEYLANYARSGKGKIIGQRRELVGIRKEGSVFPLELAITEMNVAGTRHFIGILRDITERKQQTEALEYQALHDSLTDLPNRALLTDRLQQVLLRAQRENGCLALVLLDLDRFKEINDTLGHHNGDLILQQVARRLRQELRESDTVARLGGDEFAILLPTADKERAVQIVSKLSAALEQSFPVENQMLHVGGSFGIALYPEHGDDEGTLMRRADVAMYVAKRASQGWAVYDPAKDRHSLRNLSLMSDLRTAIERDNLVLYYQPKVDLRSNKVIGVEALVRWRHPQYGLMFPDGFIPIAEQVGLINALSHWVITRAVAQCRIWHGSNMPMQIAVNLSPRNLLDTGFLQHIASGLTEACRHVLRFEITETAIMEDPQRSMSVLGALNDLGIKLSIDDYGTGYSSLAYLKKLPVDELKIDKSFVMDMSRDENNAVIVRSTIELAHNIGLTVVAEGVEDYATFHMLAEMGCDVAQGYYIGRPVPAEEFEHWLRISEWTLAKPEAAPASETETT